MKKIIMLLTLGTFFISANAFAQQEKEENDGIKPDLKISGNIYMQAEADLDDNDDTRERAYTYSVTRVYVHLKTKLNDTFSTRVSTDIAESGGKYVPYVKYAYLQAKPVLNGTKLDIRAGMINTPIADLVYKLSDYRWVYNHYAIDKQSGVLPDDLGETTADLGLRVGINLGMVNFIYANTNGNGYKDVEEDNDGNAEQSGKAHYGVLQINPVAPLFITAYGRYEVEQIENTDAATVDQTVMYYGGGVAWKTDLVRAGVYATFGQRESDGDTVNDAMIIDSYVNINLNTVVGAPVLIMGNFAYGVDSGDNAGSDDDTTTHVGAGIGYRFNDYVRMIAYYDQYLYDTESKDTTEQAAYLKLEAMF